VDALSGREEDVCGFDSGLAPSNDHNIFHLPPGESLMFLAERFGGQCGFE
jgi:hypothetical protein